MDRNYSKHIANIQERYERALTRLGDVDGLLILSGTEQYYYADDQAPPFRAYGHFCHWLPVNRPDQILLIAPGRRPIYFQVIPDDYWYDQSIENEDWWAPEFDIVTLSDCNQVGRHLKNIDRLAFIGEPETFASSTGIIPTNINPRRLLHYLDYQRACKTEYEVAQIKSANRLALQGHDAARECFLAGGTEYAIHMAYLQACEISEQDCPYTNIVALNEKAAILHYQHKRHGLPTGEKGQVLLIDAGCRINNYCSDITRTTATEDCHATFHQLLAGMADIQRQLVEEISPGKPYVDLHQSTLRQIAGLLRELQLVTCSLDEAIGLNLPQLFMPHGVGHLLGIQVHDVGGHLAGPEGSRLQPPEGLPYLRNTRTLSENMVFTIEPGFYFIGQLLDPIRASNEGKALNWKLIDELRPLGGIRIEDNVRVTASGVENLTRQSPSAVITDR
ncbi:MAG: Xaa-Pro dipeptidase [Gammaproteobacteria bacterium]|nr:Xaa-Pro dipeptidase [Gammaproteobacteria bacterium]